MSVSNTTTPNTSARTDGQRREFAPPAATGNDRNDDGEFDLALLCARLKYWFWNLSTKSLITIVYLALISQGLRYVLPDMAMRLYRLPGLAFLENFTATHRLDLAHVFAAVPLVSAWILWRLNLELYLRPELFERRFQSWNVDRIKSIVVTMGVIIIAGDALLFAAAFALGSWGTAKLSIAAVLATLVYVTVLGFVTFVSILLADSIDSLEKKEK